MKYILEYEFLGVKIKFVHTELEGFCQELERVRDAEQVSTITFYTINLYETV